MLVHSALSPPAHPLSKEPRAIALLIFNYSVIKKES